MQQVVCLLHLIELFLRHRQVKFVRIIVVSVLFSCVMITVQTELDGPTSGPDAWTGPIGLRIVTDVWLEPVVSFPPVPGRILLMPEKTVAGLSRDAALLYKLGLAVQSGVVPPGVAAATIGPPLHARWLTTAARDLRYCTSGYQCTCAQVLKAVRMVK
jgi:hypothetical protein